MARDQVGRNDQLGKTIEEQTQGGEEKERGRRQSKTKWAGMTNWIKARKKVENWEKEGGKRKCWEKEATSSPLWQDLCRLVKPEPQSPPSVPFGR